MSQLLSSEEITKAFGNADFGKVSKEDVIKYSLLKYACGFATGYTAKCILRELGFLKTDNHTLTRNGKEYLWKVFSNGNDF